MMTTFLLSFLDIIYVRSKLFTITTFKNVTSDLKMEEQN